MTTPHEGGATMEATGLTRRQALKAGAATFIGYAVAVEKVEAQAIKTDTAGKRGGGLRGEDRRLQEAGLRGAARWGRQRPDRHRDLRGVGGPRVGKGRDTT